MDCLDRTNVVQTAFCKEVLQSAVSQRIYTCTCTYIHMHTHIVHVHVHVYVLFHITCTMYMYIYMHVYCCYGTVTKAGDHSI